ncbi:hypothetical protein SERLA73DRAFT_175687 [Serpula lacrymans var. lacrymans S7.3]|uniref:Uncharacterized protein n=2 Tax=Serpula lacrymans var. lacrymans TaxID=341189 RepID=F8PL68_SERL3|nr:uncharacterized protein SERLADRAFT_458247 [Serpula lacrymans var. lacrymans S7.9]EGO03976.1 hypothetical protein SERLA73DRAFT_175687 [Serpula lacrymans var. lacrymans S7.3]EGO29896.1 hypothetical protein SERLADRAFT_458247 [Serpula lacrymans var. lacrymans S7.9]
MYTQSQPTVTLRLHAPLFTYTWTIMVLLCRRRARPKIPVTFMEISTMNKGQIILYAGTRGLSSTLT